MSKLYEKKILFTVEHIDKHMVLRAIESTFYAERTPFSVKYTVLPKDLHAHKNGQILCEKKENFSLTTKHRSCYAFLGYKHFYIFHWQFIHVPSDHCSNYVFSHKKKNENKNSLRCFKGMKQRESKVKNEGVSSSCVRIDRNSDSYQYSSQRSRRENRER